MVLDWCGFETRALRMSWALFSSMTKFFLDAVALLFICDNYYLIMN